MQIGDTYTRGPKTWRVIAIDGERVTCRRVVDDGLPMLAEVGEFSRTELREGVSVVPTGATSAQCAALILRDFSDESAPGVMARWVDYCADGMPNDDALIAVMREFAALEVSDD